MHAESHEQGLGEPDCGICLERVAQRADLPCACTVAYCTPCWDHALARSFQTCGLARCPTCRSSVRVDFDAHMGCMIFSREADDTISDGMFLMTLMRAYQQRLTLQAKPAQVRLLREYGKRLSPQAPSGAQVPDAEALAATEPSSSALPPRGQEGSRLAAEALLAAELSSGALAPPGAEASRVAVEATLAAEAASRAQVSPGTEAWRPAAGTLLAEQRQPMCMCGASLERVSGRERAFRWCRMVAPHVQSGSPAFEELLKSARSYCDLCDETIDVCEDLWTCQNGDQTILHANAFDICDTCFSSYASETTNSPR